MELPQTLSVIDDMAFCECYSIGGTVVLPSSLTSVGSRAFDRVDGVEFAYDGTETQWKALDIADDAFLPGKDIIFLKDAVPTVEPSIKPSPTTSVSASPSSAASATTSSAPSTIIPPSEHPSVSASPSPSSAVSGTPEPSVPTANPTVSVEPTQTPNPGPTPKPAPSLAVSEGYQSGIVNNKTYFQKTSGFSTMYYLKSSSGRIARVSAPYVVGDDNTRYYPMNHGGTVLFPRLENGTVTCFCIFGDGMEIPVLATAAEANPQKDEEGYQTGVVNGKTYYVKTSGASTMFYLKSSSGRMARVSAPYVTAADGIRYYPVNYGGAVLFPKQSNGRVTSYTTGSGEEILTVI